MDDFNKFNDLNNIEFKGFRFDLGNNKLLEEFISNEKKNSLWVIGKHSSGSLIASWQNDGTSNKLENPIVWIDSEGSPICVIADNYLQFLSILPYGIVLFYDIVSTWESIKSNKERFSEFSEKFNLSYCKSLLAENDNFNKDSITKIDKIINENKISIETNPFTKIIKAIENNTDFEAWLFS
jgi:hypothetical protein